MTGLVPACVLTLFGFGLVRGFAPRWSFAAALGAGAVVGPPAATTVVLLAILLGRSPREALTAGAFLVTAATLVLGWATRARPLRATRRDLPAGVAASVSAVGVIVAAAAAATPVGDGLTIYLWRARGLLELASPWAWLGDPRLRPMHPDYPLHGALLMAAGIRAAPDAPALGALLVAALVPAGVVLHLGARVAERSSSVSALVAALLATSVPLLQWTRAGYQDAALGALAAVAASALLDGAARARRGRGAPGAALDPPTRAEGELEAGANDDARRVGEVPTGPSRAPAADPGALAVGFLALGLLPWVKLEGTILATLIVAAGCGFRLLRGRRAWLGLAAAAALAAPWPLALARAGLAGLVLERVPAEPLGERLAATARGFGTALLAPDSGLVFVLLPGLVVALTVIVRRTGRGRAAALAFLFGLVALPAAALVRGASGLVLAEQLGERLYTQLLPLAALVLGGALAARGGDLGAGSEAAR